MKCWQKFLNSTVADENQIKALREWMGKLLGDGPRPEKMLFLVGPRPSGKSLLLKLLVALVGEERALESLPPRGDILEAKDKRLIVLSETPAVISEEVATTLKLLLGGDKLVGRRLHHREVESFTPTCALAASHNENLGDIALTARMLRIDMAPIRVGFRPHDPDMYSDLLKEAADIKEWALSL